MDFINLLNGIALIANPALAGKPLLQTMDQLITDTAIDSLDAVMCSVYLCDVYGVTEEVGKHMPLTTPQQMSNFLQVHKTKEPETVEAALEALV